MKQKIKTYSKLNRVRAVGFSFFLVATLSFFGVHRFRAEAQGYNPGCHEDSARIMRLYQAFFDRKPDPSGANYWINLRATNRASMDDIIYGFANSQEFHNTYSNLGNIDFVHRVYHNILGRSPDQGGFDYWLWMLNTGQVSRQNMIVAVSDSQEFRNNNPYPLTSFCNWARYHFDANGYENSSPYPGVVHGLRKTGTQTINVTFVDLKRHDIDVLVSPGLNPRPVGEYAKEVGGKVAINGNWFTSTGFDGPAISGGHNYGGHNHGYTALVGFGPGNKAHFEEHRYAGALPSWVTDAVSGHPTLVFNGQNVVRGDHEVLGDPTNYSRHPRTAIGVNYDSGVLALVVVDGRQPDGIGMTAEELADLMLSLGNHYSVMLDGGGSSTMWLEGKNIVNRPSDGFARPVGNQLVIKTGNWL